MMLSDDVVLLAAERLAACNGRSLGACGPALRAALLDDARQVLTAALPTLVHELETLRAVVGGLEALVVPSPTTQPLGADIVLRGRPDGVVIDHGKWITGSDGKPTTDRHSHGTTLADAVGMAIAVGATPAVTRGASTRADDASGRGPH